MKVSLRSACLFVLFFLFTLSPLQAAQMNYQGQSLQLKDTARACYMRFIKLYDIEYYASSSSNSRCIKLNYLREFTGEQLNEATQQIFADINGEQAAQRYQATLDQIGQRYQPVKDGDSYQYCVTENKRGVLSKEGEELISLVDEEFVNQFLRIWVKREARDSLEWNFKSC
jgi:hypothetical protein